MINEIFQKQVDLLKTRTVKSVNTKEKQYTINLIGKDLHL